LGNPKYQKDKHMETIDISKLDKAEVLAALYNNSRQQGMGFMHSRGAAGMTKEEAAEEEDEEARRERKLRKKKAANQQLTAVSSMIFGESLIA
jgi:hypothetical protein